MTAVSSPLFESVTDDSLLWSEQEVTDLLSANPLWSRRRAIDHLIGKAREEQKLQPEIARRRAEYFKAEDKAHAKLDHWHEGIAAEHELKKLQSAAEQTRKDFLRGQQQLEESKALKAAFHTDFANWPSLERNSNTGFKTVFQSIQVLAVSEKLIELLPAWLELQAAKVQAAEAAVREHAEKYGLKV